MTKADQAPRKKFDQIVKEQFDAFERSESQLRMEERKERATQFRLPVASGYQGQRPQHVRRPGQWTERPHWGAGVNHIGRRAIIAVLLIVVLLIIWQTFGAAWGSPA
jgi:hypothetical protein